MEQVSGFFSVVQFQFSERGLVLVDGLSEE